VLAGLLVAGAALRFATLGHQSYWFDEAQAAHELSLPFGAMFSSMVSHESNPPLYFVLGWLWAKVFGAGAVGLRSLSAVAGTAVIGIAYLCARELVSERAGLVAAALATVSPFLIWYSQEAREYMLLAAFCGASLLFFARALRAGSVRNLAWWAVFSALAILTHAFAAFLVAPEALALLWFVRARRTFAAVGAVALVQIALLPLILGHASSSLLGFIRSTPLGVRIEQVPAAFGLGPLYQSSVVHYSLWGAWALVVAVVVLLVAGAGKAELRGATIAGAVGAFALLAPLLLALVGTDYYLARALMPAWIPLAVAVAAACTVRRAPIPGAALAAVLLAGSIYAQAKVMGDPAYQRPDWRAVAAALGPSRGARAIVVYDGLGTDPLKLYVPRVYWQPPAAQPAVSEIDVVGSPYQTTARPLPPGLRLTGSRVVARYLVDRFSVAPGNTVSPAAMAALLTPAPPTASVLIQAP
jgi:mannosyltransferase